jgi:hypothetical protein
VALGFEASKLGGKSMNQDFNNRHLGKRDLLACNPLENRGAKINAAEQASKHVFMPQTATFRDLDQQ